MRPRGSLQSTRAAEQCQREVSSVRARQGHSGRSWRLSINIWVTGKTRVKMRSRSRGNPPLSRFLQLDRKRVPGAAASVHRERLPTVIRCTWEMIACIASIAVWQTRISNDANGWKSRPKISTPRLAARRMGTRFCKHRAIDSLFVSPREAFDYGMREFSGSSQRFSPFSRSLGRGRRRQRGRGRATSHSAPPFPSSSRATRTALYTRPRIMTRPPRLPRSPDTYRPERFLPRREHRVRGKRFHDGS